MRWLLAVLLITVPATVSAKDFMLPDGSWWTSIDPPAKWLTAPDRGPMNVKVVPKSRIAEVCYRADGSAEEHGCAFVRETDCDIYISEELRDHDTMFANVLEHEKAHCRGWSPLHPLD